MKIPFFNTSVRRTYKTTREKFMQASAASCWKAILDIDRYPQWQQAIEDAKITKHDVTGQPEEAVFELNAMIRTVQYTLSYSYPHPGREIHWSSVAGELKRIDGGCRITPGDEPGTCTVTIWFDVLPGFPIPGTVRKVLQTIALDQALQDLEVHARHYE